MSRNSKKYWQRSLAADGRGVKPMLMLLHQRRPRLPDSRPLPCRI